MIYFLIYCLLGCLTFLFLRNKNDGFFDCLLVMILWPALWIGIASVLYSERRGRL